MPSHWNLHRGGERDPCSPPPGDSATPPRTQGLLPQAPSSRCPVQPLPLSSAPDPEVQRSLVHGVSPGITSQPEAGHKSQGMDGHLPTLRLKLGTAVSYSPYRAQHHPQSPQAYPLLSCPPLPPTKATTVLGPSWSLCLSRITHTILHVGEGADGLSITQRQDLSAINVLKAACLQPSSALWQPVRRSWPAQRSLRGVTRPRSPPLAAGLGLGMAGKPSRVPA